MTKRKAKQKASAGLSRKLATKNKGSKAQQQKATAAMSTAVAAAAGVASSPSQQTNKQQAAPKKQQKKARWTKSAKQARKKTAAAEPPAPLWQLAALLPAAQQPQPQPKSQQSQPQSESQPWQQQQRKKVKVKRGNVAPPAQQQQMQPPQQEQQAQASKKKAQAPQQQQQQPPQQQQQNKKKSQQKPAAAAAARRAESPPPEQPNAKRRKVQVAAGTPTAEQLEEGRTLFAFDTNVVLGLYKSELPAAWEVLERGGGKRAQALIPLKVLLEVKSKAACRSGKYPVRAGAERALAVLASMMRNHQCCRVQREDETYRAHPKHLASQRGDDAILDCLLHFSRVGAQVVLVTQDKGFIQRAQEHGLRTVTPQQLQAALELAVGGSSSGGGGGGGGGSEEGSSQAVKRGAGAAAAAVVPQVPQPSMPLFPPGFGLESALASPAPAAPPAAPAPAAPWSERHAAELQSLLFNSTHQRQALGAAFPPFSQPLFAACATRLGQPLEAVLLAATQQLAGATVASLAGISASSPLPAHLSQPEAGPARAGLLSPSWAAVVAGAGRSPWGHSGPRPVHAVSPLAGPGMPPWGEGWPQQRHHALAGSGPGAQPLPSGWGASGFGADAAGRPPQRADTAQWQQAQAQQWQAQQQWQRQPSPSPEPWAEQQWRRHGAPAGRGGSAQMGGSWQEVRQTVQQQQQAQQQQQGAQQQQQQSVQQQQQQQQQHIQQQQPQQRPQQQQQSVPQPQHEQQPQQASRRQKQQQKQQAEREKQVQQPQQQQQLDASQPPPAQQQGKQGQQEEAAWVPEMMRLVQDDAYREQVCGNRKQRFVRVAKHLRVPVPEVMQAYEEERLRQLREQSKHVRYEEDGCGGAGEEAEAQGSDTPELQLEGLGSVSAAAAAAATVKAEAVAGKKHGNKAAKQPQRKQLLQEKQVQQKQHAEQKKQVQMQHEKQQLEDASQPPVDEEQLLARVRPLVLGALSCLPGRQGSLREVQQAIAGCPSLSAWIGGDMRSKVGGVSRWRTAAKQLLRSPSVAREVEHGGQLGGKVYQLAPCTLSLEW